MEMLNILLLIFQCLLQIIANDVHLGTRENSAIKNKRVVLKHSQHILRQRVLLIKLFHCSEVVLLFLIRRHLIVKVFTITEELILLSLMLKHVLVRCGLLNKLVLLMLKHSEAIFARSTLALLSDILGHFVGENVFAVHSLLSLIITFLLNWRQVFLPLDNFLLVILSDLISKFFDESLKLFRLIENCVMLLFFLRLRSMLLAILRSIQVVQVLRLEHELFKFAY